MGIPNYDLLKDFSADQVFDAIVTSILAHRATAQYRLVRSFNWETLTKFVQKALLPNGPFGLLKYEDGAFSHMPHQPDYMKLHAASWRFINRGLATPDYFVARAYSGTVRFDGFILTDRGLAFLERAKTDGPPRPGYLARLIKNNPDVEEEVFARLQDAESCLDAELHRPAVVMMGTAAEVTVSAAYGAIRTLSLGKAKLSAFKEQLEAIQGAVEHLSINPDDKHRLTMALDCIETIRVMRNEAAHAGYEGPDHYIAQDRFGSLCLHLPVVWNVLILPNKAAS